MIVYCPHQIAMEQLASPPARCPVLIGSRLVWETSDSRQRVEPVEWWAVYAVHRAEQTGEGGHGRDGD